MMPPAEFHDDPLKELEDEAYDAAEDEGASYERKYKDYTHIGSPVWEPIYRPGVLKEWPLHTDFRPHELEVRD
jgi:hypothetical protein